MSEKKILCLFDFFGVEDRADEVTIKRVEIYFQTGDEEPYFAGAYDAGDGSRIKILARGEDDRGYVINDVLRGHISHLVE